MYIIYMSRKLAVGIRILSIGIIRQARFLLNKSLAEKIATPQIE
jgi:hypothetical protein